ncbi:MAG: hypothetical protein Q4G68_02120 [Planctomycetia bacterium]|nr:hypothetical protein [Planctomycetia bacterium]
MLEYVKIVWNFFWSNRSIIRKHLLWLKEERLRDSADTAPEAYLAALADAEEIDLLDRALIAAARDIAEKAIVDEK